MTNVQITKINSSRFNFEIAEENRYKWVTPRSKIREKRRQESSASSRSRAAIEIQRIWRRYNRYELDRKLILLDLYDSVHGPV